jgi:hypothetical protein
MKIGKVVRTATAVAAMTAGLAIGAGSGGRWMGDTALAASPPCANYQLTTKSVAGQGAAGHILEMFRIHELLPGSCTLFGYPGVMLLDKTFYSLPSHVTRGPWPEGARAAPTLVTLNRSHDAYFVLGWEHLPTPGQKCPIARYLMIWAPNDHLPVVANAGSGDANGGIMACGGNLTVSPVAGKRFWA